MASNCVLIFAGRIGEPRGGASDLVEVYPFSQATLTIDALLDKALARLEVDYSDRINFWIETLELKRNAVNGHRAWKLLISSRIDDPRFHEASVVKQIGVQSYAAMIELEGKPASSDARSGGSASDLRGKKLLH